jgi:hypothetical protein
VVIVVSTALSLSITFMVGESVGIGWHLKKKWGGGGKGGERKGRGEEGKGGGGGHLLPVHRQYEKVLAFVWNAA